MQSIAAITSARRRARKKRIDERYNYLVDPSKSSDILAKTMRSYVPEGQKIRTSKHATKLKAVEAAIPESSPLHTLGTDIQKRFREALTDPRFSKYSPKEILTAVGASEFENRKEDVYRYTQKQKTGTFRTLFSDPVVELPGQAEWEAREKPREYASAEESALTGAGFAGVGMAAKKALTKVPIKRIAQWAAKPGLQTGIKKFGVPGKLAAAGLIAVPAFRAYEEVQQRSEEAMMKTDVGKAHPTATTIASHAFGAATGFVGAGKALFKPDLDPGTVKHLNKLKDIVFGKTVAAEGVARKPSAENLMTFWTASKREIAAAEKVAKETVKDKGKMLEAIAGGIERKALPEPLKAFRETRKALPEPRKALPEPIKASVPALKADGSLATLGSREIKPYKYGDIKTSEGVEAVLGKVAEGKTSQEAVQIVGQMEASIRRHFPMMAPKEPKVGPRVKKSLSALGYTDEAISSMSYKNTANIIRFASVDRGVVSEPLKKLVIAKPIKSKIDLSPDERHYQWARSLTPQKRFDAQEKGLISSDVNKRIVTEQRQAMGIDAKATEQELLKKIQIGPQEDLGVMSREEFISRMLTEKKGKAKPGMLIGAAGAATVAASMATPEKAEASFLGEMAKGASKSLLKAAKFAEKAKHSPKSIREKTGWFKGHDEKWRFEISDEAMTIKPWVMKQGAVESKLSNIIDHPELFEQYPELKDIKVFISGKAGTGSYSKLQKVLVAGKQYGKENQFRQTLIHEIQHAVQGIEGFASGANLASSGRFLERKALDNLKGTKSFRDIERKLLDPLSMSARENASLARRRLDLISIEKRKLGSESDAYRRYAGEIEARSAAGRIDLNPAWRKELDPYAAEMIGIADKDVIIHMEGEATRTVGMVAQAEKTLAGDFEASYIDDMEKLFKKGKPAEANKVGKKLGAEYNGVQPGLTGPIGHLFTDDKTGSTFFSSTLKEADVAAAMSNNREKWGLGKGLSVIAAAAASIPLLDLLSPREASAAGLKDVGLVVAGNVAEMLKGAAKKEVPKLLKEIKASGIVGKAQNDVSHVLPEARRSMRIIPDVADIELKGDMPELIEKAASPHLRFLYYTGVKFGQELMNNAAVQWAGAQGTAIWNAIQGQKTFRNIMRDYLPGAKSMAKEAITSFKPIVEKYHTGMQERAVHFSMRNEFNKLYRKELKKLQKKRKFKPGEYEAAEAAVARLKEKYNFHKNAYAESEAFKTEYQAAWRVVAEPLSMKPENSYMRVFLAAEDTHDFTIYPWLKGKLTLEEKAAASEIKDMMEHYGARVVEAGEKVITERPFMHHAWHPNAPTGEEAIKKFGSIGATPLTKVHSRNAGFMPMVPDAEYCMTSYLANINRTLEGINFWRKGKADGWYAYKKWIHSNPTKVPEGLIRSFDDFEKSFRPQDAGGVSKVSETIYKLEVARLLAGSLSVPFKHSLKLLADMRIFGMEGLKAMPKAAVSTTKMIIKQRGGEEWLKKRGLKLDLMDEAVEAYTETGKLYHTISEISPFRVNTSQAEKILDKVNEVGGLPTSLVERFDRALSVVASTRMAAKRGMTPAQATYSVYDTILKSNFLAGQLNPSWLKNPYVRLAMIFQSTPFKILEQRIALHGRAWAGAAKEMKQLKKDVIKGEKEFTWAMIKQGLGKQKDLFGTSLMTQSLREMLLIGTGVAVGQTYFDVDLAHHFVHPPLVKATTRGVELAVSPLVSGIIETVQEDREDYDHDFIVSEFFSNWFDSREARMPAPIPIAFKKAARLSKGDIPERYRDSKFKYLFGIPTVHK